MRWLIAVNVLSDTSFKTILDRLPQHRKYLSTVRDEMMQIRKKLEVFYLILYSIKDESVDYYFFWE
mgnify:CR=1 FL=1